MAPQCRSQLPRHLRCMSTAARLLRSWVRIPPGAWMVVCVVYCQVEVSATSWSLVQRSSTDCGASLCVIKKPREREGHSPCWAAEPEKIIIIMAPLWNHLWRNFEINWRKHSLTSWRVETAILRNNVNDGFLMFTLDLIFSTELFCDK
jgi:hypothetical protein